MFRTICFPLLVISVQSQTPSPVSGTWNNGNNNGPAPSGQYSYNNNPNNSPSSGAWNNGNNNGPAPSGQYSWNNNPNNSPSSGAWTNGNNGNNNAYGPAPSGQYSWNNNPNNSPSSGAWNSGNGNDNTTYIIITTPSMSNSGTSKTPSTSSATPSMSNSSTSTTTPSTSSATITTTPTTTREVRKSSTTVIKTDIKFEGMSANEFKDQKETITKTIAIMLAVDHTMLVISVKKTRRSLYSTFNNILNFKGILKFERRLDNGQVKIPRTLGEGDSVILEAKIFVTPAKAEVMKKKVVALKTKTEDLAESILKATGVEVSATVEDPEVLTNQTPLSEPLSEPIFLKSAPTVSPSSSGTLDEDDFMFDSLNSDTTATIATATIVVFVTVIGSFM